MTGQTATGVIMGTVDYISPEQGRGHAVDGRSDLYSIGVLLYQLLSGRLPFTADNPTSLIFQHVYEQPAPLTEIARHVPASLAAVVAKLMSKSPASRYQNVPELQADLQAVQAGSALPSGADRPQAAQEEAALPAGPRSTIIHAPRLDDEVELPASLLGDLRPMGWWQSAQGRAVSLFRRHAPEVIQQLQNTQQQLDGTVAEYARRERKLAQLAQEAESVLGELASQAASQHTAARAARSRVQKAVGSTEAHAAQAEELACAQMAAELERQAAEQDDQLGQIKLRLAQVSARLQELRNQRDILRARFKAAGVQKFVAGGVRTHRPIVTVKAVAVIMLAVVFAVAVHFYRDAQRQLAEDAAAASIHGQAPAGTRASAAASSSVTSNRTLDVPLGMTAFPLRQLNSDVRDVRAVGFNDKGSRFFAVSAYRSQSAFSVPSWSRVSGASLGVIQGMPTLAEVACSPDGEYLATATVATQATGPTIEVWRSDSGQKVQTISAQVNAVHSLAFRPDGAVLAAVTTDARGCGTVTIWGVSSGEPQATTRISEIDARFVAFAPDGDLVAIAGKDHQISLWDMPSAKIVHKLDALSKAITGMTFCPGRNILIAGDEAGNVVLWDTSTGQRLGQFERHGQAIRALAASSNGKWLATADAEQICIWNVRLGALRRVLAQPDTKILAFSPDSSVLVSSGRNGPMTVWSTDVDPQPIINGAHYGNGLNAGDVPTISTRIIPLDDQTVLFGAGQQLHRFERGLHMIVQRFSGHKGKVRAVAISRGEGLIFSGSEDGTVRVWNAKSAETVASLDVRIDSQQPVEPVMSLAATASGAKLLIGTDRSVFVWQRLPEAKLERIKASPGSVLAVAWSPDERRALAAGFSASDGQGLVRILDVAARNELRCIDARPGAVSDAQFIGATSQLVYVDGSAAHLCRSDNNNIHELRSISLPEAKMASTLGRSADGRYVSIGMGTSLSIRDAQSGDELLRVAGGNEQSQVLQSEFTPSGRFVVTLRSGNMLKWEDIFPSRTSTPSIGIPFLGNRNGDNHWYESSSTERELAWRRLELDRPAAVRLQGPADVPDLADFHADGGWSIIDGMLVRDAGAKRAAIDFGEFRETDMIFKINLETTNTVFLLVGGNGRPGHLVCKAPHDAGGDWSLYSSPDGNFSASSRVRLGKATTLDPTTVQFVLRSASFKLDVAGQPVTDWRPLPGYEPGHIVLGVVDARSGDTPLKIGSIQVKR